MLTALALVVTSPLMVRAEDVLNIEKGSVDLSSYEVLSRPFTLFDQLLYRLDKEADEVSRKLQPVKEDFRPVEGWPSTGLAFYDEVKFRVVVMF